MTKYAVFTLLVCFTLACANQENKSKESTSESDPIAIDGAKIFKQSCALCHGPDGKLGANGSKDLTISDFDLNERIAMISKGKGLMTPFENILSLAEIKAVAEYSMTLKVN
ncbi:MAG: cytochrome c [Saprospiraceae bacterium]|nr:cytochrome c [Saprospiraceae bacterium]